MKTKTFTFNIAPDLLEGLKAKAARLDLNMGQVIRRLLMAWYHDLIGLPPTLEEGDNAAFAATTRQWAQLSNQQLLTQINAACADFPDAEEQDVLAQMRYHQRQLVEDVGAW